MREFSYVISEKFTVSLATVRNNIFLEGPFLKQKNMLGNCVRNNFSRYFEMLETRHSIMKMLIIIFIRSIHIPKIQFALYPHMTQKPEYKINNYKCENKI